MRFFFLFGTGWIWTLEFYSANLKTATLSTRPLQITNIESSNLTKYPQFLDKLVIDPSTFEYNFMYGENI